MYTYVYKHHLIETALGVEVNALDNPESDLVQAFHEYVIKHIAESML